jgi:hypothetical protein
MQTGVEDQPVETILKSKLVASSTNKIKNHYSRTQTGIEHQP